MRWDERQATGPVLRVRRILRRPAASFFFALFVLANPAYFCPINCLLHSHWLHADRDGHAAAVADMCHTGPAVTAQMPPGDRELSPAVPRLEQLLPSISRELGLELTGAVTLSGSSRPAPPPPPPRA